MLSNGFVAASETYNYRQNIYMFPDEVINASQNGCSNNQPSKQSRFYRPNEKKQNYKPQQQRFNYPSTDRFSRNVAYVTDLYTTQPFNSTSFPNTLNNKPSKYVQRYIEGNKFNRQLSVNSNYQPKNNRQIFNINPQQILRSEHLIARSPMTTPGIYNNYSSSSKFLYASDFEPKQNYNNYYKNTGSYTSKEGIQYIPVPVYVYRDTESHLRKFSANIARNRLLSDYQFSRDNALRSYNPNYQDIDLDGYTDLDSLDNNYFALKRNDINPFSKKSMLDFGVFPLSDEDLQLDNVLDKYSTFSSNDEIYRPVSHSKYNLSRSDPFPIPSF